jgi:hypothetical protein
MLTEKDLIVGHVYAAKRPKEINGYYDDRMITSKGNSGLQYDSETIPHYAFLEIATIEQFLSWADRDVTAETPRGEWRKWK